MKISKRFKWLITTSTIIGTSILVSACTSFVERNFGEDKDLEKIKKEAAKINLLDFVNQEVLKEAQKDYASNAINYEIFDNKKLIEETNKISKNFEISIDFKTKGTNDEEGIFVPRLYIRHPLIQGYVNSNLFEISGFKKKEINYLENKYFNDISQTKDDVYTSFAILQSIGLMFLNETSSKKEVNTFNGTLIDFKISETEKYPLTWFVLTTANAANQNKNKNNFIDYQIKDEETIWSSLYLYNNVSSDVLEKNKSIFDISKNKILNNNIVKNVAKIDNAKTIFVGNDIMLNKPDNNDQTQEILDVSIMEVTFESEEVAKKMTNNLYSFIQHKEYPFKLINFLKSDHLLDSYEVVNNFFVTDVNDFEKTISIAYELDDLNFDDSDKIENQIKSKLRFKISLDEKSKHPVSSIKYTYNKNENEYLKDFYSVLLNDNDYIVFNNLKYRPYGIASKFKNNNITNIAFGSSLVSPIDVNYRLGINYKNTNSLYSNILYLSTNYFSEYKEYESLLPLGGYDIFNYNIGTDKNEYKKQAKSYYSELKRLYKNNITTLGTSLNDAKNNK